MSNGYRISNSEGIYFITFATVEWIDVFSRKDYKDIVIDSLKFCQKNKGLEIHAWCLMTNHIHLIVSSKIGDLSGAIRDMKKFTSTKILCAIQKNKQESRRNWMLWIFKKAGERNSRNKDYQFWQQDNHPIELLRDANSFIDQKLDYIHHNPVEAGIVDKAEEYLYSSARDYCGTNGLLEISYL